MPEDTESMRHIGGCVPENLNKIVDQALRTACTHVFIVEDDSTFERDTLLRLLAHDKPVVAGLCRQRGAPFRPYLYGGIADNGKLEWRPLRSSDHGLIGSVVVLMEAIRLVLADLTDLRHHRQNLCA